MALEYFQLVSSRSPGTAGFGQEGAGCVEHYITSEPLSLDDIQDAMRELVGDVDRSDDGRLRRTMPKAHPFYPWLACRDVQLRQVGATDGDGNVIELVEADPSLYIEPITGETAVYVRTVIQATFEPRVYDLVRDEDIEPEEIEYYLPDDDTSPTGTGTDSKEYLRFVDQEVIPAPQLASFQQGQMYFRSATGDEPGTFTDPAAFACTPFILMPDGQFMLTWYAVPYSIFLDRDHPLYRFVSHVNQTEFFGWAAGELLYKGARARRYTPTFPWYAQRGDVTAFSSEKLCDITFTFDYTKREVTDPPDLASVRGAWIAAGHNAQPWAGDRKFYVPTTEAADDTAPGEDWVPLFSSAPMQLLFTCPGES